MLFQNLINSRCSLFFLGAQHGLVDVQGLLRSRQTIGRTINDLALKYRMDLKDQLVEPLKSRSVTICPDFWTNKYNQQAFLGLSMTFVNIKYEYKSADLFCIPFNGVKSYDMILIVSYKYFLYELILCFFSALLYHVAFRFSTSITSFFLVGSATTLIGIWYYRFIKFKHNN